MLRQVAEGVHNSLRGTDVVGRWGGEEFLAILPSTDLGEATLVAERVRGALEQSAVLAGGEIVPVSVSIGAAANSEAPGDALVAEADTAMYAAKASGRNSVRFAGRPA